ncbi:phage tail protein [Leptospira kirschneri serovar Pomona]|uniref:Phage tail protein n=1 Tax=Leptospira kirschneri serovar Pomona TaxID=561005 RepID=A0A1T1DJT2_9LEPT|nr:phage tail protein [Leptospira kirschneri]OOV41126.1 phage tail protein [Leptospira kirschneri serovar Pomona]
MSFNNILSRIWDRTTPRDGLLLQAEFQRLLDNDLFLKGVTDTNASSITNLSNLINSLLIPLGGVVEDNFDQLSNSNFLHVNGQSISRATFSALWNLVRRSVTGIVAATDRISCTNHGCVEGQLVKFSFTGGGITALVNYYVRNPTTNDFQISLTDTGAILDLTSSQTGEMITNIEYGFGDGSTTFNIPDRRGVFPRGAGVHGTRAKAAGGNYNGGAVGFAGQDAMQDHRHNFSYNNVYGLIGGGGSYWLGGGTTNSGNSNLQILEPMTDGVNGTPRRSNETTPAYVAVKYKVRVA